MHLSITVIKVREAISLSELWWLDKIFWWFFTFTFKNIFSHLLINLESSGDVDSQVTWCQIQFLISGPWLILSMLILSHCILFIALQKIPVIMTKNEWVIWNTSPWELHLIWEISLFLNRISKRCLYTHVHSRFIHNSQKAKAT